MVDDTPFPGLGKWLLCQTGKGACAAWLGGLSMTVAKDVRILLMIVA